MSTNPRSRKQSWFGMVSVPALALLVLLGVRAAAPARAESPESHYRVRGTVAPGGAFVGDLVLTGTGNGVSVRQSVRLADGREWSVEGKGIRSGNTVRVAVDGGSTGILDALAGKAPAAGKTGRLEIDLRERTLRSRYVGPDGKSDASGVSSGVDWSGEEELLVADPARGTADDILDYWKQHGIFGTTSGVGGVRLATAVFRAPNERAAIVFAPGRTETFTKYAEVVRDLHPLGYSFYFLDHRGQGRSDRLAGRPPAPPDFVSPPGHVDDFDHYVTDVANFVERVVRAEPHRHIVGWGHSMGGGILTRYAQRHPGRLDALILNSPLHGLPVAWWQKAFVNLMSTVGWRRSFAWGHGPWKPSADSFDGNDTTKSRGRYDFKMDIYAKDPYLWLGGPSYGWVREAIRAGKTMRAEAAKLTLPVLLFQAGEESLVDNDAQDAVAAAAPDCTKIVFPGARHELLHERDEVRDAVLDHVLSFLESRLGS